MSVIADALRAAGGLHNPSDAETLAAAALTALAEPTQAMKDALYAEGRKVMREECDIEEGSALDFLDREGFEPVILRYWRVMLDAALKEGSDA